MKSYLSRKNSAAFHNKLEKFQNKSKKLFDFSFYKCNNRTNCNCAKEFKIPVLGRDFMNEQRINRKMCIGNCALTATKLLRKRSLRRQRHLTLPQATSEKNQAASSFIDEFVQDLSDFDKESENFFNPKFVYTSHKRKSLEAFLKSPHNLKRT